MNDLLSDLQALTILICEDGDEYLENLSRYVTGPRYLQAHDAAGAIALLRQQPIDLIYLDMRFDRIASDCLVGDIEQATHENNGERARGVRFVQNNQGLFILAALRAAGLPDLPTILAYDFARDQARWRRLKQSYPKLAWVGDAVTPDEIRAQLRLAVDDRR